MGSVVLFPFFYEVTMQVPANGGMRGKMNWRDKARPIITQVIRENSGATERDLCKALRAAYPFGPYDYHPKKIWLDEIRIQLGKKKDRRRKKGEEDKQ